MADQKPRVYSDAEIPGKLQEHGLTDWYIEDGWLRRKYRQGLRLGPQDRGRRPMAARAGRPPGRDAEQVRPQQEVTRPARRGLIRRRTLLAMTASALALSVALYTLSQAAPKSELLW